MTGSSEELARTGDYPELAANCSTITWEEANKVSSEVDILDDPDPTENHTNQA